jgi:hypothetical protein
MTGSDRVGWIVPLALGALTVTLIVAVIAARHERPSRALLAATPAILSSGEGTAPEIAALNEQLAQIAALHAGTTYGAGFTQVVRGPDTLRPTLGEEWRELGGPVGHVMVRLSGTPSRYFEISVVVVAPHGPAHLAIRTTEGQLAIEPVHPGPYQVNNFGPLLAPKRQPISLDLTSVQPNSNSPGPSLVVSPLQAEYLAPGEWVKGMPALAETGPGGLRGLYLTSGSTTPFAMTPGIHGRSVLAIHGASVGQAVRVAVTVGAEAHTALVPSHPSVTYVGPFAEASSLLSMTVSTPEGGSSGNLFIGNLRFTRG